MAAFTFCHISLDSHTLHHLPFQQAHHAPFFMNDPGNAQPPAAGWLFPHEWQEPGEPMNGVPGGEDNECDFASDESDFDDEGLFTLGGES